MGKRISDAMWDRLLSRSDAQGNRGLQTRVRELLVAAISERILHPGSAAPSSRELAEALGVARNTVTLAYDQLVDQGFLIARPRSGYYVSPDIPMAPADPSATTADDNAHSPDWPHHFAVRPSAQHNIVKPPDWQASPYPFLYGQFDPTLFPVAAWRECCRQALSTLDIRDWAPDLVDGDDEQLIEQIRMRVLPRRGVWAKPAEIMITVGAQHALFLLADLLTRDDDIVGLENPGYPDARNIFDLKRRRVLPLPVDAGGLIVGDHLKACKLIVVTPSHQCPTTRTMPIDRRQHLLSLARAHDILIIEDDYEAEMSVAVPTPALKSLDRDDRVIYIGSFSKILAPGLRLGYVIGPEPLVHEARALRRLMIRHPPVNNQRALALFLSLGHYDTFVRGLTKVLEERSSLVTEALARHLPQFIRWGQPGGSSVWLEGARSVDTRRLARRAKERGVLIEPGDIFFAESPAPSNFIRLGFSSIAAPRIEPGLAKLAEAAHTACDLPN